VIGPLSTNPVGVVDAAREPDWVRRGSAQTQRDYQAALAFEQMLVQQLTQTMSQTAGLGGEGAGAEGQEGGAAGSGTLLSALLPQALSGGVAQQGSFGIAAELTRAELPPTPKHGVSPTSGGLAA
jgi:hypothetical protein